MTDLNRNVPETSEDEDRRKFLEACGRFAVVTPPAITILLSTSLTSTAIARSGGSVGDSSDSKRSFLDDLFDNGPDDPPNGSGLGNEGQGRSFGSGGGGGSGSADGPSGSSSGGGGDRESQADSAGGSSRSSGMGRGFDEDHKPRKDKEAGKTKS